MGSSILSGLIGGLAAVALCAFISAKVRGSARQGTLRYDGNKVRLSKLLSGHGGVLRVLEQQGFQLDA